MPGSNFTKTLHKETYSTISPLTADLTTFPFAGAGASAIGFSARSDLSAAKKEIRNAVTELGKPTPQILGVKLDVSDKSSVENAAKEVEKNFKDGRIVILVNKPGALEPLMPIGESDPDAWWRVQSVIVQGTYLMMRFIIPLMLANKAMRQLANIALSGAHWTTPGMSAYQTQGS
ncbi:MAG: hypothetical protein MMC33_006016 [Icmadophila ericetorum]|nr:hypothetical protein [Icmadophila ericetorum]